MLDNKNFAADDVIIVNFNVIEYFFNGTNLYQDG